MPFSRPNLATLRSQSRGFFASYLPGADTALRRSVLGVIADLCASLVNGLYGFIDWIATQSIPYTATGSNLELWAGLKGVTRQAAVAATGQVTFSGNAGVTVPSGTQVSRSDNVILVTTASVNIGGGGTVAIAVAAKVAGASGNTPVSAPVTLVNSIAGISAAATVTTALVGGADIETDTSLRRRMLQVYASPPHGGDSADYVTWALAVAGVTRAWCVPLWAGAGTVAVYIMLDVTQSSHNGFPQGTDGVATAETRDVVATGDQLTVANAIYPQRPVTALVYVKSPVANTVNFTINGISGASSAVKTAVSNAIANVFLALGTLAGTVDLSDIEAAIAAVNGTEGFVITAPTVNIVSAAGQIPVLGTVTYT